MRKQSHRFVLVSLSLVLAPVAALAQSSPPQSSQSTPRVTLPTVTVTAQKEPADAQKLPVSVTAVSKQVIEEAGLHFISDAAIFAPNTYFSDLSARKISNAKFRGIGSSPSNPGITTYIDGVAQLNTNSSSLELLDVEQVEFVRGPQSALFGRNTLGGLVNVTSARPSLSRWTGSVAAPFGNFGAREVRGGFSGPLVDGKLGLSFAGNWAQREGFTQNLVTGNDLDFREAFTGKAQLFWTPRSDWETRLIVTGEQARDGDYALSDLAGLRQNGFTTSRDFEGSTDRDVLATTVTARHVGKRVTFSSTSGVVQWDTRDVTDLDYSPVPLITRDNTEENRQLSQEVRFASSENGAIRLGEGVALRWQAGAVVFTQKYEQDAINNFSPFVLSPFITFPVQQHSPQSTLEDFGLGVYAQGVTTFRDKVDLTLGGRFDRENKQAVLRSFFSPAIAPATTVDEDRDFSNVSPQAALAFHVMPGRTIYASAGRGFKAGGFNPASPAGSEAYGEEQAWHFEGGLKSSWADGRIIANAAAFLIDWSDLQLNLPNLFVPGQFYIANVGTATSRGVELEITGRANASLDVFGSFGYTRARFGAGSLSSGVSVADKKLPLTPDYTATFGARATRGLSRGAYLFASGEVVFYGQFEYDDMNTARQDAYSLANLRAGLRGKYVSGEVWVRNAFDTRYVPIAFAYGQLAPSGFIGESGRPRTWGISLGIGF